MIRPMRPVHSLVTIENFGGIKRLSLSMQLAGCYSFLSYAYSWLVYPPQPQLATGYVEAGSKLREGRGGQPLGEDVSKLGGSRDMEYPNITDGDSVAHEV